MMQSPVSPHASKPAPEREESRPKPKRVAVTGSSGLIGGRLLSHLRNSGYSVHPIVRRPARPGTTEIHWDPHNHQVDSSGLEGMEAIIHLAAENINGRWNKAKKERILNSRIEGTTLLCEALANLEKPPKVLISASAVGYYGDRGVNVLTEGIGPGDGFLADVCVQWEQATQPARDADIRVVNLRIGVVITAEGGALGLMLPTFKLGLGGVIGDGRQYMSWIDREDLVRIMTYAIGNHNLEGPVNTVAPEPVTNRTFTKTLGRVLRRPTLLRMPASVLRLALGEMADEMLLASVRAVPSRIQANGFEFLYADLESCLEHQLGLSPDTL